MSEEMTSDVADITLSKVKPDLKCTVTREPSGTKGMSYARDYNVQKPGAYQRFLIRWGNIFGTCGLVPCFPCSNPWKEVKQGNVGIVTQFGELAKVVDAGPVCVNNLSQRLQTVNVMTQVYDISEQSCLTRDNVIVHLKSVIYFDIVDPQKAVFGISNLYAALIERTQTTLRDVIGARTLQDVIERREQIAESIQEIIMEVAFDWGVQVESILIKDLRLDKEITQALSQAAQAKRIGESKIITAKAEVESAKLMRQAADILASKAAMQIRYLDAMQAMAKSSGSKVIFLPSTGGDIGIKDDGDGEKLLDMNKKELISAEEVTKQMSLQEGTK